MHAVPPFNKQEAKYASLCLRFLPLSGARDYIFFSSASRILPCWILSKLHSEPGSAKRRRLFKPRFCLALSGVIYSTTKSLWLAALAECAFQWFVVACFQFKQMAGAVSFCVLLKYVKQLINDSDDNNSWSRVPPPGFFFLSVLSFHFDCASVFHLFQVIFLDLLLIIKS